MASASRTRERVGAVDGRRDVGSRAGGRPPRRRGCGCAGLAGQDDRNETSDERSAGPDGQGTGQPEELDEDQAGEQRPEDRADGVRGVQPPEGPAEGRIGREVSDQTWERGAHEDRRRGDRQDSEHEPDDRQPGRPLQQGVDAAIGLVDQPERQRRDEHDDDEDELQDPVHPQWRTDPVRDPSADGSADGHPAEEAGQDRRHGLGRVPEDQDELARPDDLVDQAGSTGQDEDGEDQGSIHPAECASPAAGRVAAPNVRRDQRAMGARVHRWLDSGHACPREPRTCPGT